MSMSLKKILKQLTVLHITNIDDSYKKIDNILNVFFNKVVHYEDENLALDYFYTANPNIVVLDINLKNTNGIDIIKSIRKENKNIPIIVISANKDIDILLEAIKLNLVEYLLKPLDINKLIYSLNQTAKIILNSGDIITQVVDSIKYNYLEKTIINEKETLTLTKNEARLLELFLSNKNKIIKNEEIQRVIWPNKEISNSAFKSLLNRLSNKIGKETLTNSFGVGYGLIDK